MKVFRIILISLTILFSISTTFSQQDTLLEKKDSINVALLENYNVKLSEIEKQRIADSLKKSELEAEISQLKTTDNLKKEELLAQLTELNSRDAKRISEKKARIDSLRNGSKGFGVKGFFNDTLFHIYARLGSFSAQERATAIQDRVRSLTDNIGFVNDSLKIVAAETTEDIVYGEKIILSVSENDALWNDTSKLELATLYRDLIGAAVDRYKNETSLFTLAKEIGLALLVLLIIGVLIFYIIKLFRWTAHKIQAQENKRIRGLKIKDYTLFDAGRQVKALLIANKILKWFVVLLAIYIALPILFGIFPWTQNFADTLIGYVLDPLKSILLSFWNYLPNLITIIVIVFVFKYVLKGIHFLKNEIQDGNLKLNGFYPDWPRQRIKLLGFWYLHLCL